MVPTHAAFAAVFGAMLALGAIDAVEAFFGVGHARADVFFGLGWRGEGNASGRNEQPECGENFHGRIKADRRRGRQILFCCRNRWQRLWLLPPVWQIATGAKPRQ